MKPKYAIGIDLGTTNSMLAYVAIEAENPTVSILPIPQLTAHSQIESLLALPSFVWIAKSEFADRDAISVSAALGKCPYSSLNSISGNRIVVGEFARRSAAESPEQCIVAAKSWLCHSAVDRQSAILPWGTDGSFELLSPVQASRLILEHLISAWAVAFPDAPIAEQQVVLTVPASFDLAARELTFVAAREAGLPDGFIALEEPQAAVYHWIAKTGQHWRRELQAGDEIFVCDVGGGTTDLALIKAEQKDGELSLQRVAVGQHLLIGGDNMDLALAHFSASKFSDAGSKLNAWQSMSLWHTARNAKESLLSGSEQKSYTVSVLGRASKLIGGTVSIELSASEVEEVLIEGFFPFCDSDARPISTSTVGFQEIGLPYEQDTAITRHVAAFLSDNRSEAALDGDGKRIKLLFNGGVFRSDALRNRLLAVMNNFQEANAMSDAGPIAVLGGVEDLDAAVASGAAYYAWSKQNGGVRIRGGTGHSYYVGIETAGLAVPGMPRPLNALCVVPKGMEEGTEVEVPSRDIGLVVGYPASFRFFASANRSDDQVGTLLKHWDDDELQETAPMQTELQKDASIGDAKIVPVRFISKITELGMFELWCSQQGGDNEWKLEMNVRS